MRHRKGRVVISEKHVKMSKRTVTVKTYRKAPGQASGKPPGYKKGCDPLDNPLKHLNIALQ